MEGKSQGDRDTGKWNVRTKWRGRFTGLRLFLITYMDFLRVPILWNWDNARIVISSGGSCTHRMLTLFLKLKILNEWYYFYLTNNDCYLHWLPSYCTPNKAISINSGYSTHEPYFILCTGLTLIRHEPFSRRLRPCIWLQIIICMHTARQEGCAGSTRPCPCQDQVAACPAA